MIQYICHNIVQGVEIMYHISNDKRSIESSKKIYKSLRRILLHKTLDEVSVTDIQKECGVSRSTFYRLFDNVVDVIELMFDYFYKRYLKQLKTKTNKNLFFFQYWNKHSDLVYILSHQNEAVIKRVMMSNLENDEKNQYLVDIKVSILSSILSRWVLNNKIETPEEIEKLTHDILNKKCIDIITE